MSLGNWGQSFLNDVAGGFFGNEYLRDYTHASKTFRTNSYQNAPKLKFLFHTYFDINPVAFQPGDANFGLLVKDIKLPNFSINTHQYNQYNRKRIIQSKIKYDPIDITFHDDGANQINQLWQAYYSYYYNDGAKIDQYSGSQYNTTGAGGVPAFNDKNIYDESITDNDEWGFMGGQTTSDGKKAAFFRNITIFGFNQHNFTAYTLVNPLITSFSHDSYSYSEAAGIMQNKMTIDYETVVYTYGKMDGRSPGNIVAGFGDDTVYDTRLSPIANPGANGTVLGQGGLVDGVGGTIDALARGDILGAIRSAGNTINTTKNLNIKKTIGNELEQMLNDSLVNTPNKTRNVLFSTPTAGTSISRVGKANSPVIGGILTPPSISDQSLAGYQVNSTTNDIIAQFKANVKNQLRGT